MNENVQYSHFDRTVQLLEWMRYKEAIEEAENYIHMYPNDADGYSLLGKIYLEVDEYDKALHWSQEALRKDPENPLAWEVRAGTLYTKEDWKAAKKAIEEALVLFPEDSFYYFLEGNIYLRNGKFQKSNQCFEHALKREPYNPLYLANYSYVQAMLGNQQSSLETEKQALELAPENSTVFMYLAWAADQRGEHQKALQYLENAVRINPENQQIRKEYIEILQKQYTLYRIFLLPSKLLAKIKPWAAILIWISAWFLFKPLVLLFIILYVAAHWASRIIVNVKVFGRLWGS